MDILIGIISVGALVIVQLVAFAFGYGKLKQLAEDNRTSIDSLGKQVSDLNKASSEIQIKVTDLSTRVKMLENVYNTK